MIRDAEENRISVIDLFEDIAISAFPVMLPRLSMIWALSRDEGDAGEFSGNIVLRLNDQILLQTDLDVNFQGGLATRSITVIGGLALHAPGQFSATWSIPSQAEAKYEVTISAQPHVSNVEGQAGVHGIIS